MDSPSVGRMVHYYPPEGQGGGFYAAIIVQVNSGGMNVELATFGPNSLYFQHGVEFSPEPKPGHWSWPKRA